MAPTDLMNDNHFSGRVGIVTGAASGIGRATARLLASLGASIAVVDCNERGVSDTVSQIQDAGDSAFGVVTDLKDHADIEHWVNQVQSELGPLTILVNNAAIIFSDPIFDTSIERWSEVLAVNLTAPFLLIKSVGRHMIEHGNGGNIVNVVSAAAFRAVRTGGAYGVSKAGLASLTRAASWELGQFGINVNAVAPGVTATEGAAEWFGGADALQQSVMSGPYANLLQRSSEPMDVSNTVAFLCSPLSRQITAQVIHVSAGSVV